jgi:cytochrome b6-f complex iron-sulfur subunit
MTPEPDIPARMNRRQFLILTTAALVTSCRTSFAADKSTRAAHERVVNAGPVSKYAADGVYTGFIDQGFFIVRKGEKLFALSSFCTHRKCKLTAESDRSFYCPCHGSTFAPGGKVTAGPAKRDLQMLASYTDEKGELFVRVPDV